MTRTRKYIVIGTLTFALGETIALFPMIWPNGLHTTRNYIFFVIFFLLAIGAGWLGMVLMLRTMKRAGLVK